MANEDGGSDVEIVSSSEGKKHGNTKKELPEVLIPAKQAMPHVTTTPERPGSKSARTGCSGSSGVDSRPQRSRHPPDRLHRTTSENVDPENATKTAEHGTSGPNGDSEEDSDFTISPGSGSHINTAAARRSTTTKNLSTLTKNDLVVELQETVAKLKKTKSLRTIDRKQLQGSKERGKQLRDRVKDLEELLYNEQATWRVEKRNLEAALVERQKDFAEAEVSLRKSSKEKQLPTKADPIIRSTLGTILKNLDGWVKHYARAKPENVEGFIKKHIVLECAIDQSPRNVNRLISGLSRSRVLIKIQLLAYLSRRVWNEFFKTPFGFFPFRVFGQQGPFVLNQMYKRFSKDDRASACDWRATTARQVGLADVAAKVTDDQLSLDCGELAAKLIREIDQDYKFLKPCSPEETQQRLHELIEIFDQTGRLSAALWCQKTDIASSIIAVFDTNFAYKSETVEAYSAMGVDDDNTIFEGRPIDMVIVPPVSAYGTSEGELYEVQKWWSKAIVMIFDDDGHAPNPHFNGEPVKSSLETAPSKRIKGNDGKVYVPASSQADAAMTTTSQTIERNPDTLSHQACTTHEQNEQATRVAPTRSATVNKVANRHSTIHQDQMSASSNARVVDETLDMPTTSEERKIRDDAERIERINKESRQAGEQYRRLKAQEEHEKSRSKQASGHKIGEQTSMNEPLTMSGYQHNKITKRKDQYHLENIKVEPESDPLRADDAQGIEVKIKREQSPEAQNFNKMEITTPSGIPHEVEKRKYAAVNASSREHQQEHLGEGSISADNHEDVHDVENKVDTAGRHKKAEHKILAKVELSIE